MKSWKYALTAALLPASLWAATITGTVGAPAPGTPVSGAKVVLINSGNSAHVDSTTTAGNGVYTFSNVAIGPYQVMAGKSGYNSAVVLASINTAGQTVTANISITINNYTGVFTGTVRKGSDSTPFINATVRLTAGPIDPAGNKTAQTDSSGNYRFDSVYAGVGYTITASAPNYLNAVAGNQAVAWNSSAGVGTLYLNQSLGTLSGTIRRSDTTSIVLVGAKIVVWQDTVKIDSTTSDSLGNYGLTLNAGNYTLKISLAGYKGINGVATKDTTVTISFGQNSVRNQNLTPARSNFQGTAHVTNATGAPIPGVKIVLLRRPTTAGAYVRLDSTVTDANGNYAFTGLISAVAAANGSYQFISSKAGYGTAANNTNPVTSAATQVGFQATVTYNPILVISTAIIPFSGNNQGMRITTLGDHLTLDLGVSNTLRTISVFNLNGSLQHQVNVPAGESHAVVPGIFAPANGYLFQVK